MQEHQARAKPWHWKDTSLIFVMPIRTGIRKEWQLPLLCNNWGYCLNLQSTVIYERKLLSRTENNAYVASK